MQSDALLKNEGVSGQSLCMNMPTIRIWMKGSPVAV